MSEQLTELELKEFAARVAQFKRMSPKERTTKLGFFEFVALSRCKDEKANQIFDAFCKGEADRAREEAFFNHIAACTLCYSAILRLVWAVTDHAGY